MQKIVYFTILGAMLLQIAGSFLIQTNPNSLQYSIIFLILFGAFVFATSASENTKESLFIAVIVCCISFANILYIVFSHIHLLLIIMLAINAVALFLALEGLQKKPHKRTVRVNKEPIIPSSLPPHKDPVITYAKNKAS